MATNSSTLTISDIVSMAKSTSSRERERGRLLAAQAFGVSVEALDEMLGSRHPHENVHSTPQHDEAKIASESDGHKSAGFDCVYCGYNSPTKTGLKNHQRGPNCTAYVKRQGLAPETVSNNTHPDEVAAWVESQQEVLNYTKAYIEGSYVWVQLPEKNADSSKLLSANGFRYVDTPKHPTSWYNPTYGYNWPKSYTVVIK